MYTQGRRVEVGTLLQCWRGGGCVEIGRRLGTGRRGRDENAAAALRSRVVRRRRHRRGGKGTFRDGMQVNSRPQSAAPCSVWRCRCRCRRRSDGAVCFAESQWGVPQASGTNPPWVTSRHRQHRSRFPGPRLAAPPWPEAAAAAFSPVFFSPLFRRLYIIIRKLGLSRSFSHVRDTYTAHSRSIHLSHSHSRYLSFSSSLSLRFSVIVRSPSHSFAGSAPSRTYIVARESTTSCTILYLKYEPLSPHEPTANLVDYNIIIYYDYDYAMIILLLFSIRHSTNAYRDVESTLNRYTAIVVHRSNTNYLDYSENCSRNECRGYNTGKFHEIFLNLNFR